MRHKRTKKLIAWKLIEKRDLMSAALHHATAETEAEHISSLGLGIAIRVIPNGIECPRELKAQANRETRNNTRVALFLSPNPPPKKGFQC